MQSVRRACALAASIVVAIVLSTVPGETGNSFDGRWWVQAAAAPGTCSDSYGMGIKITNGQVAYRGLLAAFATGSVTLNGRLSLKIGEAHVTGQLSETTGLGRWASPNCKGSWTAARV